MTGTASAAEWSDRTRDVYVDGRLDRGARVFAAAESADAAVIVEECPRVMVVDGEGLTVSWLDKDAIRLAGDGTSAVSEAEPEVDGAGTVQEVDDRSLLIAAGGHVVLLARHQGLTGDVSLDELWRTVPLWKRLTAAYEPDADAVRALRTLDRDVEVRIAFGTWCGDSKRYVPELLKTIEAADNPRIHLRLTSIRGGFKHPMEFVRDARVTNVPTVIVSAAGREIGRIVETPAGEKVEADLAAILAGEVPNHQGRWDREERLAWGVYEYEDADGASLGREEWEVFSREGGGRLLHCVTHLDDRTTEIWQRLEPEGRPSFVEITRTGEHETARSRHWFEDGQLRSITRGNTTGIIEQTAELPPNWTVLLPAAAAAVPMTSSYNGPALRLAGAGSPATGLLELTAFESMDRQEIETPAGSFLAEHVARRVGSASSEWWLHPELGIPVAGTVEGSGRIVLTDLDFLASSGAKTVP